MKKYVYIGILSKLSTSQIMVQMSHVVWEIARAFPQQEHPSVVMLALNSSEQIKNFKKKCEDNNLGIKEFKERLFGFETTAVACEPVGEDFRKIFKNYKLLDDKILHKPELASQQSSFKKYLHLNCLTKSDFIKKYNFSEKDIYCHNHVIGESSSRIKEIING